MEEFQWDREVHELEKELNETWNGENQSLQWKMNCACVADTQHTSDASRDDGATPMIFTVHSFYFQNLLDTLPIN